VILEFYDWVLVYSIPFTTLFNSGITSLLNHWFLACQMLFLGEGGVAF